MSALTYVGRAASGAASKGLVTKAVLDAGLAGSISPAQVDSSINSQLAPYATTSYVNTQDGLNTTKTYVDTQDNLRLKLTQKNAVNGVLPLGADTKAPANRFNVAAASPRLKPWYRPTSYPASAFYAGETVTTWAIASPGYNYKILVWGSLETQGDSTPRFASVEVRVGSNSGEVIASGIGQAEALNPYNGVVLWGGTQLSPVNLETTATLSGAKTLYLVGIGKPGPNGIQVTSFHACVFAVIVPV